MVEKRKEYTENEILTQIEHVKNHLESLETELKERLSDNCENTKLNLQKLDKTQRPNIDYIKDSFHNLKAIRLNTAKDLSRDTNPNIIYNLQHQSLNKCLSHLSEVNEINESFNEVIDEIKFYPNVEMPTTSLIGLLKKVKETNHIESFRNLSGNFQVVKIKPGHDNTSLPITPRYLCVADHSTLFFTDSQNKQLVQANLDSGEFIRATSLNGLLKTPDGICVNTRTGHIYVGENESKCIFKLDSQFNILKKFGQKELKWPRGMAYDSDVINDAMNIPDRLYVCDYSAQKVVLFNEHDQLRDCLTISISDEGPKIPSLATSNQMSSFDYNDEFSKFCPLNVFVNKNFIYVTDDWTGGNCIRVFNKRTHALLMNVRDLHFWNPLGVYVDNLGNIFTMARVYYETGLTNLFCFDREGKLQYQTCLNINNEVITDIVLDKYTDVTNPRIICCGEKKIHFFKFE